jgi:molybdate transport system substrate-binding protein
MIQIAGISSMATRQILADLAKSYERRSECSVAFTSIGGVEAERRLRTGRQ